VVQWPTIPLNTSTLYFLTSSSEFCCRRQASSTALPYAFVPVSMTTEVALSDQRVHPTTGLSSMTTMMCSYSPAVYTYPSCAQLPSTNTSTPNLHSIEMKAEQSTQELFIRFIYVSNLHYEVLFSIRLILNLPCIPTHARWRADELPVGRRRYARVWYGRYLASTTTRQDRRWSWRTSTSSRWGHDLVVTNQSLAC